MPKDNIHYGGWEHRDVHNIVGMLFVNASLVFTLHHSLTYNLSDSPTSHLKA